MEQSKKISRKVISVLLSLLMVFSCFSGMSLTAWAASTTYIDGSGKSQTVDATELAASTTSWTDGSWYIAPAGGLTISGRITVNGTVNLILRDGATLTASVGITTTGATLNIYAQSAGTGALIATGSKIGRKIGGSAGIGGGASDSATGGAGGNVNIYGGTVTATGGNGGGNGGSGAGIGGGGGGLSANGGAGGNVNIYGGTVTATGGNGGGNAGGGAGIGGGGSGMHASGGAGGNVNIYGGTVTATGGNGKTGSGGGAGIGGGGGDEANAGAGGNVNIYGGTVTAKGGNGDAGGANGEGIGDGGKGNGGNAASTAGTLTLGKGVKLYEGTDNTGTVLDGNDSASRVYSGEKKASMYAEFISAGSVDEITWEGSILKSLTDSNGITVTGDGIAYAAAGLMFQQHSGPINFSASNGYFTKIVITCNELENRSGATISGFTQSGNTLTWTGESANVTIPQNSRGLSLYGVTSIKFTGVGLIPTVDKSALETAITAAETLYDSIKDDTNYSTIASTLKTAIDTAKAVADSDEADQNAVDAAKTAITTAKTNAEAAKKDVDDTNAANAVITKINALPAADDVTTANKEAIEAARAAYNALTDDQKKKVDATVLAKLTNAETALQDAVDTEAAQGATNTINALPAADEVTTADKDAIEAARKAYNDLTDDQKKKVDADTLKKLTDAEAALKDAIDTEAAQAATNTINALPAADEVTTADKDTIEAARKAYNDLTDDQKKKVSDDTLKKLTDAENALKAAGASDKITALPEANAVKTSDKEAIEQARAAYNALTDEQKEYVSADTLKKLTDAENALAAAGASDKITALPEANAVKASDKEAIEQARAAYNALTDEQKEYVSADTLKKLTDAENALAAVEVSDEINALPAASDVTTADKDAIEQARAAYDALTDEQKAFVSDETLERLTDAEETLFNKQIVDAVDKITNLPNASKVKASDKDAIEAARAAYDALTDEQKEYVSARTAKKLTDAENALAPALVNDMINTLPAASDVTTADKEAIEAARKAYNTLTDEQKEKVSADTLKKLTDAEDALAAATVSDAINALPAADDVTANDKDAIEAARKAYASLTDEQKANVSADTIKKLADDEAALKRIIEAEVAAVEDAINALPAANDVTTADKTAIEAARAAYNELTDEQKEKVDSDNLKKLTDAEDALAAAEVSEAINELPAADDVTTDDEEDIKAAKAAYDALTDEQKAYVSADTLEKLEAAEEALNALLKDGWVKDGDNWYFYKKGVMQKGWVKSPYSGKWYFMDKETGIMKTGWVKDGNDWYYLSNKDGAMQTGWVKTNGNWYFLKSSGIMATGWIHDNGEWYYLNDNGAMVTGWLLYRGDWYYLSNRTGEMQTGWVKTNGKWYYLNADGKMRTADLNYNGKVYHFDSTGACTNP